LLLGRNQARVDIAWDVINGRVNHRHFPSASGSPSLRAVSRSSWDRS
jgi:hypothetical protein